MEERKTITIGEIKHSIYPLFQDGIKAKINLHNKKSFNIDSVYSTIILPLDKALKIFGDVDVMYPQFTTYKYSDEFGECILPCIKFGVVVE